MNLVCQWTAPLSTGIVLVIFTQHCVDCVVHGTIFLLTIVHTCLNHHVMHQDTSNHHLVNVITMMIVDWMAQPQKFDLQYTKSSFNILPPTS
jgi:hypothetical protein